MSILRKATQKAFIYSLGCPRDQSWALYYSFCIYLILNTLQDVMDLKFISMLMILNFTLHLRNLTFYPQWAILNNVCGKLKIGCLVTLFLKINEDKTKFLMISSDDDLNRIYTDLCISFSGNVLVPSSSAVNLGVTFDSTMSMDKYINVFVSKGYFKLNNFWRNADKLTYDLKLLLVTTYILPLIYYCNITFLASSKSMLLSLRDSRTLLLI